MKLKIVGAIVCLNRVSTIAYVFLVQRVLTQQPSHLQAVPRYNALTKDRVFIVLIFLLFLWKCTSVSKENKTQCVDGCLQIMICLRNVDLIRPNNGFSCRTSGPVWKSNRSNVLGYLFERKTESNWVGLSIILKNETIDSITYNVVMSLATDSTVTEDRHY